MQLLLLLLLILKLLLPILQLLLWPELLLLLHLLLLLLILLLLQLLVSGFPQNSSLSISLSSTNVRDALQSRQRPQNFWETPKDQEWEHETLRASFRRLQMVSRYHLLYFERNKLGLTLVGNGDCVIVPGSCLWAKSSSFLHRHFAISRRCRWQCHLSPFDSIDGQYWISVYRSAVSASVGDGAVVCRDDWLASTHAKVGTRGFHSVKSKKQNPN